MKKLITLLLAAVFLTACSEDQLTTENELQVSQNKDSHLNAVDEYKKSFDNYMLASISEAESLSGETETLLKQSSDKRSNRRLFRKSQLKSLDLAKSSNSAIKVPGDYSTLQEAVDNAEPNGQILVVGALEDQGEVYIDVPGIRITGNSKGSITGEAIFFMSDNIEISNLELSIYLILNGDEDDADGARIFNNNISSYEGPYVGAITMINVSGCIIKNNTIDGLGTSSTSGIYASGCSDISIESNTIYGGESTICHMIFSSLNNSEVKNCVVKNGGDPLNSAIYFYNYPNNNLIKGCTVQNVNGRGITLNGGDYFNRGKNNQIVGCTVKNYSGVETNSSGIAMFNVESSSIKNCEVNNKDAADPVNVFSEGINLNNSTDGKIENCTSVYNSGGGIAMSFGLSGTNSIIGSKANNNGGAVFKSQLGCFGIVTIPQFVNGSIIIDNCEVSYNRAIGDPLQYDFYIRAALSTSYGGLDNNFSHIISNCEVNNNTGAEAIGVSAGDFSQIFPFPNSPNPNVTWNIQNNTVNSNDIGIGLTGTFGAVVANNTAKNNSICDYGERDLTGLVIGTVLTNNNFGTVCDNPIP